MKRMFEEPIIEVIGFSVEDVITTSYTPDPDEGGDTPIEG